MPTSAPGRTSSEWDRPPGLSGSLSAASFGARGVTLVEMVAVMAIIGILAALLFPAVSSGLDSIRLAGAADSLVSYLNGALNRAERRQQAVEIEISIKDNALWMRTAQPGFERRLGLPDGVRIEAVLPPLPGGGEDVRTVIVMPGSTPPRVGIQIVNRRGMRRIVRVDPMTGVPRIEVPAAQS